MRISLQQYERDFFKAADPLRWAVEPMSIPRYRDEHGHKRIFQVNSNAEIAQGYKNKYFRFGRSEEHRTPPLKRLTTSTFKWHICRRETHPNLPRSKDWVFGQYPKQASFIQFDVDRHYYRPLYKYEVELGLERDPSRSGLTPEDKVEIDVAFREEIDLILELAESLDATPVCTTSPGDIFDGEHVQGCYVWIKLPKAYPIETLHILCQHLKKKFNVTAECSWDSKNRNIRLPGQRYVEVCDPVTLQLVDPIEDKTSESLGGFAKAWNDAIPVNAERLEQLIQQVVAPPESSKHWGPVPICPVGPLTTDKGNTTEPDRVVNGTHTFSRTAPEGDIDYVTKMRDTKNPFVRSTMDRICSNLTIRYQADEKYFDAAVDEAKKRLTYISPSDSDTCGNPTVLDQTMRRWMRWYFANYKPDKVKDGARSRRDMEDEKRLAYCMGLDEYRIMRLVNLSFREKRLLSSFLKLVSKFQGRVATKIIYEGSSPLCSRSEWFCLLAKLRKVIVVLDEYGVNKCRQWGLSAGFVSRIKESEQIAKEVSEILDQEAVERKKRERVYGETQRKRPVGHLKSCTSTILIDINGQDGGWDDGFWEDPTN